MECPPAHIRTRARACIQGSRRCRARGRLLHELPNVPLFNEQWEAFDFQLEGHARLWIVSAESKSRRTSASSFLTLAALVAFESSC